MKTKGKKPGGPSPLKASTAQTATDRRFESVIETLGKEAGITQTRMFGSTGLKVHDKVFSMLFKGRLVVKLPKERADAIVAYGEGEYFDPGHGRKSKQWVAIGPGSKAEWLHLAEEARDFVALQG